MLVSYMFCIQENTMILVLSDCSDNNFFNERRANNLEQFKNLDNCSVYISVPIIV